MANAQNTDKQIAVISVERPQHAHCASKEIGEVWTFVAVDDELRKTRRHISVLHIAPVISAMITDKSAIAREFKTCESAAE